MNCDVAPTFGAVPVTDTDVTVGVVGEGVVGVEVEEGDDEPHAQIVTARASALPVEIIHRDITVHLRRSSPMRFELGGHPPEPYLLTARHM